MEISDCRPPTPRLTRVEAVNTRDTLYDKIFHFEGPQELEKPLHEKKLKEIYFSFGYLLLGKAQEALKNRSQNAAGYSACALFAGTAVQNFLAAHDQEIPVL